jgi:hypothetical protein
MGVSASGTNSRARGVAEGEDAMETDLAVELTSGTFPAVPGVWYVSYVYPSGA